MPKRNITPSMPWRREIFGSQPRRDVDKLSKSTTRIPIYMPHQNRYAYAEGGNEATALLLLKYLHRQGVVSRFKEQAFALHEIGGPQDRVPDILVELAVDSSLHVVQVKSNRFITEEVKQKFDLERSFVQEKGFSFHVWTDKDHLNAHTSEAVRAIDRGFRFKPSMEKLLEIKQVASTSTTLGQILEKFGWDDSIAAAASGIFYISILEQINEKSAITNNFSSSQYNHLFESGTVLSGWWELLAS